MIENKQMKTKLNLLIKIFIIIVISQRVFANEMCTSDFENLKEIAGFEKCPPLVWVERNAKDGMPLKLSLSNNPLHLKITKGESEWMRSDVMMCRDNNRLYFEFTEKPTLVNPKVLPLANSSLKIKAQMEVNLSLSSMKLRAHPLWTGHFIPASKANNECKED
jgi:hypothetical protein